MIDSVHILAKDDDVVKVVIGLVVGAIWLISAIVGAAKKQKPQGQPKPWEEVIRDLGQMAGPPPPPPPVQQQRQQRPPPMPKQQQQKRKKKQQQSRAQPVAAAKPVAQFEESSTHRVVEEVQPIAVSSVGARAVPPTVSLGKTSMMLTPTTIREAMILTEVLNKPVSMREQ
jgi:outer membrane biosynthesis protein TonB